jgi:hypothetical protein
MMSARSSVGFSALLFAPTMPVEPVHVTVMSVPPIAICLHASHFDQG